MSRRKVATRNRIAGACDYAVALHNASPEYATDIAMQTWLVDNRREVSRSKPNAPRLANAMTRWILCRASTRDVAMLRAYAASVGYRGTTAG